MNNEFPIRDFDDQSPLQNINPLAFPKFLGLSSKDLDTFIFEFEVVCRTYDYFIDAKKLRFSPSTLKDASLRWFMSVATNNKATWEKMKDTFMEIYRDYCKSKDTKEDIFKMTQEE